MKIIFTGPRRTRTDVGLRRVWKSRDYRIHRTGDWPFVCWHRFGPGAEDFEPIGENRTLRAAQRRCEKHAKRVSEVAHA